MGVEFSQVPVDDAPGGERVQEVRSDAPAERPEERAARRSDRVQTASALGNPERVAEIGSRSLSAEARARVAAIQERRSRAAGGGSATATTTTATPAGTATVGAPAATADPPPIAASVSSADDDQDDADDQVVTATGSSTSGTATPSPRTAAPSPPAGADHPELAEARAVIARQERLLADTHAELDRARKGGDDDARARHQALRDAEDAYLESPTQAIRKYVAAANGIKDIASKDVDAELDSVIADLIAERNGVQLDPAYRAERQSVLTKRVLQRDRDRTAGRERDAEAAKATTTRDQHVATSQRIIAQTLDSNDERGNQRKAAYPNLTAMSMLLEGRTPEQAIWTVIETGTKQGLIDPNDPDDKIIAKAASIAETYYRTRAEQLRRVLNNGTAAPSPPPATQAGASAAVASEEKARKGHGPRTLTNADASVAPATSAQTPPDTQQRPRFKNDDERRRWVLEKHKHLLRPRK